MQKFTRFNNRLFFLITVIVMQGCCSGHAQFNIRFDYLTIEDDLSSGSIRAIVQDSTGFIWIGTTDGLNRYDGLSFRVFNQIPGDTNSLSNNFIYRLLVDRKGRLWAGTLDGLNFYDHKTERFLKIDLNRTAPDAPRKLEIFYIAADYDNNIWVATSYRAGIFKVSVSENRNNYQFNCEFVPVYIKDWDSDPESKWFYSVFFNSPNEGWLGYTNGIKRIFRNNKSHAWQMENASDNFDPAIKNSLIPEMLISDPAGPRSVLAMVANGTIYRISYAANKYHIKPFFYDNKANEALCYMHDKSDNIWLATNGNGLLRHQYRKTLQGEQIFFQQSYFHNSLQPGSLINNQVYALFEDRAGLIWAGTDLGVSIYNPSKENFNTLSLFSEGNEKPVSITALLTYKEWLIAGTDNSGLYLKNLQTQKTHRIQRYTNSETQLADNIILSMLKDRNDNLWVGTVKGLSLLQKNELQKKVSAAGKEVGLNPAFTTLLPIAGDDSSLSRRMIFALMEDKSGIIWAGTSSGLNGIDPVSHKVFIKFNSNKPANHRISNGIIRCLMQDASGNIWVGTEDGLNFIHSKTKDITIFLNQPRNPSSLSGNRISSLAQTPDSAIWVGTNGTGLNRFDPLTNSFKHYTMANGLPNNVIYAIIDDRNGNLWLSTNNGLSRFNIRTETFTNYDVNDGLKSNAFNQGSAFRTADGEIFFGNINGINSFLPERITKNTYVPPIVITDFRIFDNSVFDGAYPDKFFSLTAQNKLVLNSNENFFSFEFAALNYINAKKNQYRYKLEGLNTDWINNGNRRYVSFTNMSPGDYVFNVTGSNNDGVWNPDGLKIMLTINPPWFKTIYAKLGAFLLVSLLIYLVVYMRIQTVRKEKEREFASRSAKIKQQFLANMSHEIRTPMNAIVGMTRLLLAKNPRNDQKKYLDAINRSSDHLLVIINDVLDYSKIEEGKMKLEFVPFNIRELMNDLFETFQLKAEEKKLDFKCMVNDNVPVAVIGDSVRISEVLINMVGNAIKFTHEGSVTVDCLNLGNHVDANGNVVPDVKNIRFTVSDTGIGIPENQLEIIFESFSQSDANSHRQFGGTGLGLTISRQLVELHGGKISVISKQNQGSVFSFTIPLEVTDSSNIRIPENKLADVSTALSKLKILLVEDNELNQIVAIDTLQFHLPGISVDVAANGKAAVEKIRQNEYDVVLMDIQMPIMDGYEATRIIRQELPEPKNNTMIIAMTAGALKSEAERCLNAGMDDYISKPFDSAILIEKLSFHCRGANEKTP